MHLRAVSAVSGSFHPTETPIALTSDATPPSIVACPLNHTPLRRRPPPRVHHASQDYCFRAARRSVLPYTVRDPGVQQPTRPSPRPYYYPPPPALLSHLRRSIAFMCEAGGERDLSQMCFSLLMNGAGLQSRACLLTFLG